MNKPVNNSIRIIQATASEQGVAFTETKRIAVQSHLLLGVKRLMEIMQDELDDKGIPARVYQYRDEVPTKAAYGIKQ